MYTYEERKKAVDLYFKYDQALAATTKKLGYPSVGALRQWIREFQSSDKLHKKYQRTSWKYMLAQKEVAVNHYLDYGQCYARTIRKFGYPNKTTLRKWVEEYAPSTRKVRQNSIHYTKQEKEAAVLALCTRSLSAKSIANDFGVTRQALYLWKNKLLGKGATKPLKSMNVTPEIKLLKEERDILQREVYKLRLEKEILEQASDLIKKEPGIDPIILTNKEKTQVIDALCSKYSVIELLRILDLPKSSYYYHRKQLAIPDKYLKERSLIVQLFHDNKVRYGYRRIYCSLKLLGITLSEKVVRRIMTEEKLKVKSLRLRKYNSYGGEITPAVPNLLKRDFKADQPNKKWLTDITEFHIPPGKVYLSPIIDCFDGAIVSWTISTKPNADMVNSILENAIATLNPKDSPIVHSDRGAHYRWPGWIKRMKEACLVRSMFKKGYSPDNSACEGFFGRLKNEFFYGQDWKSISIDQFITDLDNYILWYNKKRIKCSLGGLSPLDYRKKLGIL
ncbi:IS3 family transposase [Enterococcus casseliflavus]|uniref:IS3 family transposase n=1 Tax=Enterococcus casseliflavus TaxID=37734 RepID=UPI001AD6964A|nr:IS3 family transposase [Enterococcus casseliflavus]MBO6383959.1 IS3 family transposase [Enterococcus casseliflavus]